MNPWDRQDGETETAWRAFVAYRDNPCPTLPRDPDGIKMAVSHAWVTRKRAWDKYWDEYTQEERKQSIRLAEQRAADIAAETAYLGMQVALNEIRAVLRRQESFAGEGNAKFMEIKEALALFKTCHDAWLKIHGQATENIAITTQVKDLSLEDIDAYLAKLNSLGK